MLKKIFKYQLYTHGTEVVLLPEGAEILCVQNQLETPCIWAIVDPEAPIEERRFITLGTGHPVPEGINLKYIGTYQLMGGAFVYHVFEVMS